MTDTDLRTTATHELGHLAALASLPHLGEPTAVSVVPDATTGGRMLWPALASVARQHVEDAATVLLAGLAAEERDRGDGAPLLALEEHGAGIDTRAIAELLLRHGIRGDDADRLVTRATERARALVRELWPLVTAFAPMLERVGVLEGEALRAVCASVAELRRVRADAFRFTMQTVAEAMTAEATRSRVERSRMASKPGTRGRA